MTYPVADLDASHELWQDALGRTNAFRYTERQALLAAAEGKEPQAKANSSADLTDINAFFQIEGKGPKLLEFEFDPVSPDPIAYVNKCGRLLIFGGGHIA
jgi:hypothetical protein